MESPCWVSKSVFLMTWKKDICAKPCPCAKSYISPRCFLPGAQSVSAVLLMPESCAGYQVDDHHCWWRLLWIVKILILAFNNWLYNLQGCAFWSDKETLKAYSCYCEQMYIQIVYHHDCRWCDGRLLIDGVRNTSVMKSSCQLLILCLSIENLKNWIGELLVQLADNKGRSESRPSCSKNDARQRVRDKQLEEC